MTAYDKNAALKHYNELVHFENMYFRRRYFRKFLPIVLTLAFAAISYYSYQQDFHGEKTIFIGVGVITAFVLLGLYPFRSGWLRSSTLYYQIKGSTDARGNHRCIQCGGRGIWRSGQYKSSAVYCYCSKCQFGLWKE